MAVVCNSFNNARIKDNLEIVDKEDVIKEDEINEEDYTLDINSVLPRIFKGVINVGIYNIIQIILIISGIVLCIFEIYILIKIKK